MSEPLIPKEDSLKNYSPVIRFEITGRLLEGLPVYFIEPNYNGSTWAGAGKDLYLIKNGIIAETYTLDYSVRNISVAGDGSLWIATDFYCFQIRQKKLFMGCNYRGEFIPSSCL